MSPGLLPEGERQGALAGIRVLDLTRYIPGPYCTMILGDLGADVVKLEGPPIGDPTRAVPPAIGEQSAVHAALNRNKRSLIVDLRKEEGATVARRLAAKADVLVESFRPDVLARRGLGYEELARENPRLVYCSITGYGQAGELSQSAGHDVNYAARGGFLGTTRDSDGRPVLPTTQVADMTGGLVSVIGVLAALQARERTGRGQLVDVSLLAGVLALMTVPAARLAGGGSLVNELTGTHACYNVYRCKDGRFLSVGALEPKFWEALCRALGLEDCINRQWERPEPARATIERLAGIFASRDRDEWIRELRPADACVEPVLELGEALRQAQAAGVLVGHGRQAGGFRSLGTPLRFAGTPASGRHSAPGPGQHTDEVMGEIGYSRAEIERLREDGVLM